ncbi:MAG: 3-dehydroquinate synthase [Cytophagales bacterium]|nr:3-dehydroquinate synthase [Cytophagales bacterium]
MSTVIQVTADVRGTLASFLESQSYTQLAVIVDENTKAFCYPLIKDVCPNHILVEIKSGEENKTLSTCEKIWQAMTDAAFDRKSMVLNLGGGVIGDMGGFCAAAYKRGIRFVNVPTTLLSQVDASVGGKLGIDFGAFKNHIGFFKTPEAVIISPEFFRTLPGRELRSGFAEVVKHALIADRKQWSELRSSSFESLDWLEVVPYSVKIKEGVVAEDPTEQGLRKILNFGHTIGHAVESHLLHTDRKVLHGEAVALGMICESYLSFKLGYLTAEELKEIEQHLDSFYPRIALEEGELEPVYSNCLQDKKNEGQIVYASLLEKIGQANYHQPLNKEMILDSLRYYLK